jgi:hypothetical protein
VSDNVDRAEKGSAGCLDGDYGTYKLLSGKTLHDAFGEAESGQMLKSRLEHVLLLIKQLPIY